MISNFKKFESNKEGKVAPKLVIAVAAEVNLLRAISVAQSKGSIQGILVGSHRKIVQIAIDEAIDINAMEIINCDNNELACVMAAEMIRDGKADFIMKGLVDTSIFLKAIINKQHGLMTGHLLSSVMVFEIETYHKLIILSDPGMTISPNAEQKKEILENTIELARLFKINPIKVGCLAAKEKVNPRMQATVDAQFLKELGKNGYFGDDVIVDGPMAMDLIISKEAAKVKGYISEVAGDADIIIAPNIETGNALMKSMTHLAKAKMAGLVMGANVPIVMGSRSDSFDNKLNSIILGAYIANKKRV